MKLSMKVWVSLFIALYLGACCPKGNEPIKKEERKVQVSNSIAELRNAQPFYWQEGERHILEVSAEGQEWLLCSFPEHFPEDKIPYGWRLCSPEEHKPLYRPKLYATSSERYYSGFLPKGQAIPEGGKVLYRGTMYHTSLPKEQVWDNDQILVKLVSTTAFKDLAELADFLDLLIIKRANDTVDWYILSARHSPYKAWQIAHILYQDRAIATAKPYFSAYSF